ncbi:activator protein MtlR [unidentified eubacterium SCB49]|nr:activator protein MtlR [unidentified eubacterium SCB49]
MNKNNKAAFKRIDPSFGSSFTVRVFDEAWKNSIPFYHFHPEIEMVYVKDGSGKSHIGNHLSCYQGGKLMLIGSGLPHSGFIDRMTRNVSEVVVQMKEDFLGKDFFNIPEMERVKQLFERAKMGISFLGKAKDAIGARMERLEKLEGFERLLELLAILKMMADTEEYELLNAKEFAMEVKQQDNPRINQIYNFVQNNFKRTITLEEISEEVNMTIPAFCRYFKKQSGKTFTQFVNEFRVVHTCKLLSQEHLSITDIAFESGFNNFSHFNKLFKERTGYKPSEYRNAITQILK